MKLLRKINFVSVTGLSLAAGLPKIGRSSNEVAVFSGAGLGETAVVTFGLLQLAAGVLLLIPGARLWGAALATFMFLGSAAMLLSTGQIPFGLVSLLPAAMASVVAWNSLPRRDEPPSSPFGRSV